MKKYILLIAMVLLFVSCGTSSTPDPTKEKTVKSAKKESLEAIDFTLTGLDGEQYTLSDYRGQVVIIDFWATFCPPCRDEIPHFIDFHTRYKDEGLIILGIGLDREEKLAPFSKSMGINYPILIDDRKTSSAYGVKSIPTTFILNREGEIVKKFVGFSPGLEKEMEKEILPLLKREKGIE